jgi:hypothetical protein
LQHHAFPNSELLYSFTNLNNFPYNLMAGIRVTMVRKSCWCNTWIAVCIDKVQVASTNPS